MAGPGLSGLAGFASRFDWRGWLALAWAVGFGILYAQSMLQARLPGLLGAFKRSLGG